MWSSGRQKPKGRPVGPEHGTPMEATGRPGPDRRPAPGAASTQTERGTMEVLQEGRRYPTTPPGLQGRKRVHDRTPVG